MEDGREKRNSNVLAYQRECGATEASPGPAEMLKDPAFPFGKKELFDMLALQITDIYEKYYPEAKEE